MSNFRWGGAAFSGRCACSRHGGGGWRGGLTEGLSGEEVPKINFISTNFAYLQFQTGLPSKLLFLHHPHSACEPYPAHCRLMPSVSFVSSPHPQPQVLISSSWALGLLAAPSSSTPHLTIWWVYPVSPALHLYNRFHFILHSSILMITFSGC